MQDRSQCVYQAQAFAPFVPGTTATTGVLTNTPRQINEGQRDALIGSSRLSELGLAHRNACDESQLSSISIRR